MGNFMQNIVAVSMILLLPLFACKLKDRQIVVDSSFDPAAAGTGTGTGTTTAAADATINEKAGVPTDITGVYLACDYTQKATVAKPETHVGCRIADQSSGHKVATSKFSDYAFGYADPKVAKVTMTTPSSDAPWQVEYSLTGDYASLQTIGTLFKVGLKATTRGTEYYQPVDSLVGRLNILMEGDWKSNQCFALSNDGTGNTPQYYVLRTDHMKAGLYSTTMDYYTNATCSQTPEWTETIAGAFTNVTFDGLFFYTDARTDTDKYHVNTSAAADYLNSWCKASGVTFAMNTDSDGIKCASYTMEYSTMEINEGEERIYTAYPTDPNDGSTAQKRESSIDATWYLQKQ